MPWLKAGRCTLQARRRWHSRWQRNGPANRTWNAHISRRGLFARVILRLRSRFTLKLRNNGLMVCGDVVEKP
jgi:hypothetical protein